MELETQNLSTSSSPRAYVTAPASPNAYGGIGSMEFYYSAPTSPRKRFGYAAINSGDSKQKLSDDQTSKFDDFEFETRKKFSGQLRMETRKNLESSLGGDYPNDQCLEHEDSVPIMAFADELFLNGLVMPLKLPPRLQYDSDYSSCSRMSPALSPKSPRTMCRLPFARRNARNGDGFDPFMVALQKVREETRGRNRSHRRSRSYSPFRAMPKGSSDIDSSSRDFRKGDGSDKQVVQVYKPSFSGPLDFKGSNYARWVRDQTREGGVNPKRALAKSPRSFIFGQRVRPVKTEQDGTDELTSARGKYVKEKWGNANKESKLQKLKGLILRYASFGRVNNGSKPRKMTSEVGKTSYLSRLSFKRKGNATEKKKNLYADTKMAVVEYKPQVALHSGYGFGSPGKMNRFNKINR